MPDLPTSWNLLTFAAKKGISNKNDVKIKMGPNDIYTTSKLTSAIGILCKLKPKTLSMINAIEVASSWNK